MAAPWEKYKNPAANYGPDPYKVAEEKRKEQAAQLAAEAAARAAQAADRANQNSAVSNSNSQAMTQLARERFEYEKNKGSRAPLTAKERADAIAGYNAATSIDRLVKQMEAQYAAGPGATKGPMGLTDYLPFTENQQFDRTGNSVRGHVGTALGFTGGQLNSVAEAEAAVGPYLPSSGDRDQVILDKIQRLKDLANDARTRSVAILGGIPDQYGNLTQAPQAQPAAPQQNDNMSPAGVLPPQDGGPRMPNMVGGLPQGTDIQFNFAKPDGGFDRNAWLMSNYGITPNQEAGITAFLKANRGNPNFSYKDLAAFYKGIGAPPPVEQPELIDRIRKGNVEVTGYSSKMAEDLFNTKMAARTQQLDTTGGAFDTFGRTAADALTFGNADRFAAGMDTLTGDGSYSENLARQRFETEASRNANPLSALAGDVTGVIGATAGTARAGNAAAQRFFPAFARQGVAGTSIPRTLLNDASYGAVYSASKDQNPFTGAATAATGSLGGQILGKGLQKGFTGVTDPAVQYLTQRGIPLSIGEMMGSNSIIGRNMQKLESMPYLGDLMAARRGEAKDAVYRAALEDAVAPVGGQLDTANPLASAQQTVSGAYDNAVGNVTVPFDARFANEFGNARNMASTLPPDLKGKFDAAMASRVEPLTVNRSNLPMPSQLNTPRVPTVEEMRKFSRIEEVPLSAARSGQSQMAWAEQNAGKYADPLIDGFADRPVAVRLENGEYVIKDGNHRTVRAFNEGQQSIPAYVVDAKSFDPANAGRAAAPETQNIDELLAALTDAGMVPAATQSTAQSLPTAITGKQYQQTMRGLSGYKSEATKPGFEQDYRDAISMVQDALKGQMMRNGGESVVTGLNKADSAYSMLKPIEQATITAGGTPTPKQMLRAFTTNTKKFGGVGAAARGDKIPDVVRYAAENAPTISNSGTADRLGVIAPLLLPTALGGSSYAVSDMSPTSAGFLATLAAMSTKTGQKALQKAITTRSPSALKVGGLFGSRKAQKALGAGGAGALLSLYGN